MDEDEIPDEILEAIAAADAMESRLAGVTLSHLLGSRRDLVQDIEQELLKLLDRNGMPITDAQQAVIDAFALSTRTAWYQEMLEDSAKLAPEIDRLQQALYPDGLPPDPDTEQELREEIARIDAIRRIDPETDDEWAKPWFEQWLREEIARIDAIRRIDPEIEGEAIDE